MVRLSKQERRRRITNKRPKFSGEKSKESGTRVARPVHMNSLPVDQAHLAFIPKI